MVRDGPDQATAFPAEGGRRPRSTTCATGSRAVPSTASGAYWLSSTRRGAGGDQSRASGGRARRGPRSRAGSGAPRSRAMCASRAGRRRRRRGNEQEGEHGSERRTRGGAGHVPRAPCRRRRAAAGAPRGRAARGRAILPPELPWNGASRALVRAAERSLGHARRARAASSRTPSYDETVAWLRKLVAAAPRAAPGLARQERRGARPLDGGRLAARARARPRRCAPTASRRCSPRPASTPARSTARTPA